jgi:hypothetical protein
VSCAAVAAVKPAAGKRHRSEKLACRKCKDADAVPAGAEKDGGG